MSGTSLDGVDAVLLDAAAAPRVLASVHHPFDEPLRRELLALNAPGDNEIDRCARLGNELARRYAAAVGELLRASGKTARRRSAPSAATARRCATAPTAATRCRSATPPCSPS